MGRVGLVAGAVAFTLWCVLMAVVFGDSSPDTAATSARRETRPAEAPGLDGAHATVQEVVEPADLGGLASRALEQTALPLRLVGTVVAADPAQSQGVIEPEPSGQSQVVRVGDFLDAHREVQVVAIEPGRVILLNEDRREELRVSAGRAGPQLAQRQQSLESGPESPAEQMAALAAIPEWALPPGRDDALARDLADLAVDDGRIRSGPALLEGGRFSPVLAADQRQMLGLQIEGIEPGSFYERIGFQDGDVIASVNGIELRTLAAGNEMLLELSQADALEIEFGNGEAPIQLSRRRLDALLQERGADAP